MASSRKRRPKPRPSTDFAAREVIEVKAGVFKDTCLQLLDRVHERSTEVLVTKHGTVVACVIPPESQRRSAFGFMSGTVLAHDDIVAPDLDEWGELS